MAKTILTMSFFFVCLFSLFGSPFAVDDWYFMATKTCLGKRLWCEFQGRQGFALQQESWKVKYSLSVSDSGGTEHALSSATWMLLPESLNLQLIMQRSREGLGLMLSVLFGAFSVQWWQPGHPNQLFSGITQAVLGGPASPGSRPSILQVSSSNVLVIL